MVHPCCGMYQYFIPFYGQVIFCYEYATSFIESSIDGCLGFLLLALMNSAAVNIHVQVFV